VEADDGFGDLGPGAAAGGDRPAGVDADDGDLYGVDEGRDVEPGQDGVVPGVVEGKGDVPGSLVFDEDTEAVVAADLDVAHAMDRVVFGRVQKIRTVDRDGVLGPLHAP